MYQLYSLKLEIESEPRINSDYLYFSGKDFKRSVREFRKGLTREQIIGLQTHLEGLGYSPKGIDARIGQNTRAAINRLLGTAVFPGCSTSIARSSTSCRSYSSRSRYPVI